MFEASESIMLAKNLDSTPINKIAKKTNNIENSSSSAGTREQQKTIDPELIITIHRNKGAIDTFRGQITELRHDVDQLRAEMNHRRTRNLPDNNETRRLSKPEITNLNPTSVSHHHHHHHHVEQPVPAGHSSVCILL
jgi:hypothetical protein